MTIHYVGVDPGAALGLALLVDELPRPRLLGVWDVSGARHLWHRRLREAIEELDDLVEGPTPVCWVEDWSEARGEARSRHLAWKGLGHAQGAICQAWYARTGQVPVLVPVSDEAPARHAQPRRGWTSLLGLAAGKHEGFDGQPKGWHRVDEAALRVAGPVREQLADVPNARRVDVAEAILIAAAAWTSAREQQRGARLAQAAAVSRGGR